MSHYLGIENMIEYCGVHQPNITIYRPQNTTHYVWIMLNNELLALITLEQYQTLRNRLHRRFRFHAMEKIPTFETYSNEFPYQQPCDSRTFATLQRFILMIPSISIYPIKPTLETYGIYNKLHSYRIYATQDGRVMKCVKASLADMIPEHSLYTNVEINSIHHIQNRKYTIVHAPPVPAIIQTNLRRLSNNADTNGSDEGDFN